MKTTKVSVGKKVACSIGISLASILIIVAFCGRYFNSGFKYFANFFLGSFGMSFYGLMAAVIIACSFVLAGKSIKIPAKYVVHFVLMFVAIVLFVHILTTTYIPKNFKEYIGLVYHYYDDLQGLPTFGGVVFGILAFALEKVLTIYGAMVVVVALLGWTVYVCGDFFYSYFTGKLTLTSKKQKEDDIAPSQATVGLPEIENESADIAREKAYKILFENQELTISPDPVVKKSGEERFDVAQQSQIDGSKKNYDKSQAEDILFGTQPNDKSDSGNSFFSSKNKETSKKNADDDFIVRGYYGAPSQQSDNREEVSSNDWKITSPFKEDKSPFQPEVKEKEISVAPVRSSVNEEKREVNLDPVDVTDVVVDDSLSEKDDFSSTVYTPFVSQETVKEVIAEQPISESKPSVSEEKRNPVVKEKPSKPRINDDEIVAVPRVDTIDGKYEQNGFDFISKKEYDESQKIHRYLDYNIPPFELLNDVTISEDHEADDRERSAQAIVNKLSVFGIKVENVDIIVGPSVTRYTFKVLSQKTRMGDFKQYSDDIKACVEAQEDIRIEAPIHGTGLVGIEVANKVKSSVVLRSLLESQEFEKGKGKLVFAIGREITGKVVVADLADMPHLLIAGTTGSGKSVCLNCLIVSMIYKYSPEYVRFLMVDPKFVELSRYNGIPHMLTAEAITNVQDALSGMDYLINEMEARYQLFRQSGVGNISEYNSRINPQITQKLPYLVFVVDELADLMSVSKKAFEQKLMRLAQKSRAAGIHIVLATQRPSVDVITGTIKANLPCRMALKVASQADSSTILGGGGAEKLLGKGDMLFVDAGASDSVRVQGAYISNDEIRSLVEFSKASNEVYYDPKINDAIFVKPEPEEANEAEPVSKEAQLDPYCKKALRYWLEKNGGKASIASIQRNLGIGFNRAGRIMDSLQKLKYVEELSPSDPSSKPLRVLISLDEIDSLFPDMQD